MSTVEIVEQRAQVEVVDETHIVVVQQTTREVVEIGIAGPQGIPGPPGPPGPSGSAFHRESPAGAIDGVNMIFSTSVPFVTGTTVVFLNGLAQSEPEDYVEMTNTTVVLDEPPQSGDQLRILFQEA